MKPCDALHFLHFTPFCDRADGRCRGAGGVALGATIIHLLFWSFGFLRMGMTGMTAQAEGAGDTGEGEAMLLRLSYVCRALAPGACLPASLRSVALAKAAP